MRREPSWPVRFHRWCGLAVGAAVSAADRRRHRGRTWRAIGDLASGLGRVDISGAGGEGRSLIEPGHPHFDFELLADSEHQASGQQRVTAKREETVIAIKVTASPVVRWEQQPPDLGEMLLSRAPR